jgi:hypothetical protein
MPKYPLNLYPDDVFSRTQGIPHPFYPGYNIPTDIVSSGRGIPTLSYPLAKYPHGHRIPGCSIDGTFILWTRYPHRDIPGHSIPETYYPVEKVSSREYYVRGYLCGDTLSTTGNRSPLFIEPCYCDCGIWLTKTCSE